MVGGEIGVFSFQSVWRQGYRCPGKPSAYRGRAMMFGGGGVGGSEGAT